MNIQKITRALLILSFVAIVFNVARADFSSTSSISYLIWNLALAWIPYIISTYCTKKDTSIKHFIPFFIIWLLFFPNAPYLVTDVLHIAGRLSPLLWYDSLLFFFFGWIGLLLGILSLLQIHQYIRAHLSYKLSEGIVFIICFISSFGIYLGRFERWNSWDIVANPAELLQHSFNISTGLTQMGTPLLFISVFTIFMYAIYKTVYVLVEN